VPGLIKRDDVDAVLERARIEDVVTESGVSLRPAGVGSLKGLCPFHDERTASFHVRPTVGRYHCFGCGEGGDAIAFIQKTNGMAFTEAVEYLADRVGIQLRYEATQRDSAPATDGIKRARLLAANAAAADFYAKQLAEPAAAAGRKFLTERAFGRQDAARFGVGYAPTSWDALTRYLQGQGFTGAELIAAGLAIDGKRGVYDRFRGRLVWPIRDTAGAVVGFGARRLYDEDPGPKYLNTPETALYKKSHVLYGVDLAKRQIAAEKQVVVVEGYTDVMAAHLSGVETAVATCGTAFGSEHAKALRRLMGDHDASSGLQLASGQQLGGAVIFTFDGDAAGRKAAERAFGEDQRFHAQTFVAIAPDGMDPCELRIARGPAAVRALIEDRVPLFEYVIRAKLQRYDLDTIEGRVGAMRETAPLVAAIRDRAMQLGYARSLAQWIGMDPEEVRQAVAGARRGAVAHAPRQAAPDSADPVVRAERLALAAVLQMAALVPDGFDDWDLQTFAIPAFRAVHAAVQAAGGLTAARQMTPAAWVRIVREQVGDDLGQLVDELAVLELPENRPDYLPAMAAGCVNAVAKLALTREIAEARSKLQRIDPTVNPDRHAAAFGKLVELENRRRSLQSG